MSEIEKVPIEKMVVHFGDIPYERKSIERVLTGFNDLDYFIKGIEVGITEILGETNVGKSIFTSMLIDQAIEQSYKVGVFAGEHSLRQYKMLLMQQKAVKGEFDIVPFIDNRGRETNIADYYVNERKEKELAKKYDNSIYLYDVRRDDRSADTICEWLKYCYNQNGVRFFVLDNLMEIDNNSQNQYQEQAHILSRIRNIALKLGLFIILVMHTNKGNADSFRMTIKNAYGSSFVTNKGYNVIGIYRKDCIYVSKGQEKVLDRFKEDLAKNGFDYDNCSSFIDVMKTKGNCNGLIGLLFNAENKTYTQAPKVSKTKADEIIRKIVKQSSFMDLKPIENDDTLPF